MRLTLGLEATDSTRERSVFHMTEAFVFIEGVDGHKSRSAHITPVLGTSTWSVFHLMSLQD